VGTLCGGMDVTTLGEGWTSGVITGENNEKNSKNLTEKTDYDFRSLIYYR